MTWLYQLLLPPVRPGHPLPGSKAADSQAADSQAADSRKLLEMAEAAREVEEDIPGATLANLAGVAGLKVGQTMCFK